MGGFCESGLLRLGGYEILCVLDRDEKRFINSGKRGEAKDAKGRLVMNFDLEESG